MQKAALRLWNMEVSVRQGHWEDCRGPGQLQRVRPLI